jgi:hypothetical protein
MRRLLPRANRGTVTAVTATSGRHGAACPARHNRRRARRDRRRARRTATAWDNAHRTTGVTVVPGMVAMMHGHTTGCGRRTTTVGPRRLGQDKEQTECHDGKGSASHDPLHGLSPQAANPGRFKNYECLIAVARLWGLKNDARDRAIGMRARHAPKSERCAASGEVTRPCGNEAERRGAHNSWEASSV